MRKRTAVIELPVIPAGSPKVTMTWTRAGIEFTHCVNGIVQPAEDAAEGFRRMYARDTTYAMHRTVNGVDLRKPLWARTVFRLRYHWSALKRRFR